MSLNVAFSIVYFEKCWQVGSGTTLLSDLSSSFTYFFVKFVQQLREFPDQLLRGTPVTRTRHDPLGLNFRATNNISSTLLFNI